MNWYAVEGKECGANIRYLEEMRNRPGLNIFPCSHQLHITLTLLRPQKRFTPNDTERHHQIWSPFILPQKIVILGWRVGTLYLLSCWRWWVNQFRGGVASKGPRPILLLLLSLHPMMENTIQYSILVYNHPLLLDGYIPSLSFTPFLEPSEWVSRQNCKIPKYQTK